MKKIIKYVFVDILRNKIITGYTILLALITIGVFQLDNNSAKSMLSLLNLVLFIVPLVSIIFTNIYLYNSSEFIELLVSQPLKRKKIWFSLYTSIASSFVISFLLATGLPVLIYCNNELGYILIGVGCMLNLIFVSLAFLVNVFTNDKAKGIGIAIFLWLYFALIFDGLVLFLLFQFADYPLEKAMLVASCFNPLDLGRILILLKMDVSALMGYTGAVFKYFFGTNTGFFVAFAVLALWAIVPFIASLHKFKNKDL